MASSGVEAAEGAWQPERGAGWLRSAAAGLLSFARRKPLGFACGLLILALMVIGDLFPVTLNAIVSLTGLDYRVPYLADAIAPDHYSDPDLLNRLKGPSSAHLLGTDSGGRDLLSRLIYGARVSVIVPFGAVLISTLISTVVGVGSAYYGGWTDRIALRLVDIFQALPGLVLLISVLGLFGSGLWQMLIAIGILQGPPGARLIRSQGLAVMASPYIEAARVVGARDARLMAAHVLPNVMPLVILSSTLRLGNVVLLEASLSFLGFGLPPPFPSWGQMLSLDGRQYMRIQPGLAVYPGVAIALAVFSYNLLGDALRDVLDPRLRGRR
jgi:peptide/nickel transport system permease protein